jgi:hypothetical protein
MMKTLSQRLTDFKSGKRVTPRTFGPGAWVEGGYVLYDGQPRRSAGEAHKLRNLGHTGWYADNHQDMLYVGEVWRLPHGRFVAGYVEESGTTVLDGCIYDDERDAAMAADGCAESAAEKSREFYAKDRAEQDILQAREEIHELNNEALETLRELKAVTLPPAICSAVKGSLMALLSKRKQAFKLIAAREHDYWSAVST